MARAAVLRVSVTLVSVLVLGLGAYARASDIETALDFGPNTDGHWESFAVDGTDIPVRITDYWTNPDNTRVEVRELVIQGRSYILYSLMDDNLNTQRVTFNGQVFFSTDQDDPDAFPWLEDQIRKVIAATVSRSVESPLSPVHRATELVLGNLLLTQVLPVTMKTGAAEAKPAADAGEGEPVLAANHGPAASWDMSSVSSLQYEKTWYDDSSCTSDRAGLAAQARFDWDRVSLYLALPVDRMWFSTGFDELEFTRVGLIAAPRVQLLYEEAHKLDLALGVSTFYFHTFMDDDGEDPDHAGLGPFLSLQKTLGKVTASLGTIWQRGWNLEGERESTGHTYADVSKVGVGLGLPLGERWALNARTLYTHTWDLPAAMDADYWTLQLGASYAVRDAWTVDLTAERHLGYETADNLGVHLGMTHLF